MNAIKPGTIIKMTYDGMWTIYDHSSYGVYSKTKAVVNINLGDIGIVLQQETNNPMCWLILIKQQMVYIKDVYFKVIGNI